jgi:hypothetical protein
MLCARQSLPYIIITKQWQKLYTYNMVIKKIVQKSNNEFIQLVKISRLNCLIRKKKHLFLLLFNQQWIGLSGKYFGLFKQMVKSSISSFKIWKIFGRKRRTHHIIYANDGENFILIYNNLKKKIKKDEALLLVCKFFIYILQSFDQMFNQLIK